MEHPIKRRHWATAALTMALFAAGGTGRADAPGWLGRFSEGERSDWQMTRFKGTTDYRLADVDGETAMRAHSAGSASALYREIAVDLDRTPVLRWRWRVDRGPRGLDERVRSGDDYAARVYVVHKRGLLSKPLAVNYVWSGSQPRDSQWPNAWLPEHSMMVALRGEEDPHGQWFEESRDVRADFRALLGVEVDEVHVLVLMSDTDNQRGDALAWYGDIGFFAE